MARWYYGGADNPTGPIDQTDLVRLAAEGAIEPTDLVWRDGSSKWVLAARVKGLQFGSPPPPPPPQPAKPVSLFAAEVAETAKALRWMAAGGIIGAALGIPISYLLQPQFLRVFVGFGGYLTRFGDMWSGPLDDVRTTAHLSVIGCAVLGVMLGARAASSRRPRSHRWS